MSTNPSSQSSEKENQFWNNDTIVTYFSQKPPDPRIKFRLEKVTARKEKKALDLGCGGGRHTQMLCELGFDTYACDVNEEMVQETHNRLSQALGNLVGERIVHANMLELPYENDFFDVAITTGVLHQAKSIEEYQRAITELSRVLKLGGVVALNIFTNKEMDPTYSSVKDNPYTVITRGGLWMTLLPKTLFYEMMTKGKLALEEELIEETKMENTGPRVVLRANFIKHQTN